MNYWMHAVTLHPLFGFVLTLGAYAISYALWRRLAEPALLHPVLIGTAAVGVMLLLTSTSYTDYQSQTMVLNEGLGFVIVLLAVPLYRQMRMLRDASTAILAALVFGSLMAIGSALVYPMLAGTDTAMLATLAAKSSTTAVAVEVSQRLGGYTSLTAVVVISTGIVGAVLGPALLKSVQVTDERAFGFAIGLASHAIGTARAFQISGVAGAFASLGMILNAILTILLVPILFASLLH